MVRSDSEGIPFIVQEFIFFRNQIRIKLFTGQILFIEYWEKIVTNGLSLFPGKTFFTLNGKEMEAFAFYLEREITKTYYPQAYPYLSSNFFYNCHFENSIAVTGKKW